MRRITPTAIAIAALCAALAGAAPGVAQAGPAPTTTPAISAAPSVQHRQPAAARPKPRPGTKRVNCARVKCIALTFDDGPGPGTERVVKALHAKGAHATFFMLGSSAKARPQTVRKVARTRGMEIGAHTMTHRQLTGLSDSAIRAEMVTNRQQLTRLSGRPVRLVRPPYGARNARVDHIAKQARLAEVLWNVDTEDWRNRSTAITTQRALSGARAGSIILMHDIHPSTVRAVPGIVNALQRRGFHLVTVSELLGSTRPGRAYYSR
ncbi:polysaccharide deacetylase family protein [Janibacter sp. GXQ6167]|uniref:polysaccharide deacetylase family protein n=1 Tax=Janibacter sp. GXQ6167 TaxID=3240791 RepID=UPI0035267A78